jgi:hypothetical protein
VDVVLEAEVVLVLVHVVGVVGVPVVVRVVGHVHHLTRAGCAVPVRSR